MQVLTSLFGSDADVLEETDFQLLLLANVVSPLGTALLSPVLDSLIEPFGASPASIGLLMSFYVAPAIVMIPVAGVLADRFGRKTVLVPSLVLFGLSGSAIAFSTDFRLALALRLVQGIAYGGITPILITVIGDLYDGARETTAQGLRFMGSGISTATLPLLSGILVAFAWQYPFLLYTISFPIAVLVYVWLEEPVDDGDAAADGWRVYARAQHRLLKNPVVLASVLGRGFPIVAWFTFITYNSIIVAQILDETAAVAGVLVVVASVSYATAASQAGRVAEFFAGPAPPLVIGNVCLGIGLPVVLVTDNLFAVGLGVAVTGVGFGIQLSLYRSLVTNLAPPELRGGLVSIAETGDRVAASITPVVLGAVIAVVEPAFGFRQAIQLAVLLGATVSAGGGLLCLGIVYSADPASRVRFELTDT